MRVLDFYELKQQIPLTSVLAALGWDGRYSGAPGQMRGRCLIHGSAPGSRSFAVKDGKWYCFKCRKGGDVIDFWAALHGVTVRDAAFMLRRQFG